MAAKPPPSALTTWLVVLLVALAPSVPAQQARFDGVSRVVAFGDVHGAYDALAALLQTSEVIDADLAWTGGATHLVSVGDLLDRGADSRRVMDLLIRLESEAAAAGGRVHVVLGNHELMNLIGDLRYVAEGEYLAFAEDETDAMRDAAFARLAASAEPPPSRQDFDARYPRGYFAHRAAFASDGEYGAWLLDKPAIVVIDSTAFVHGGLPALVAETTLNELNTRLTATLERYLELRSELAERNLLDPIDMQEDLSRIQAALASDAPAATSAAAPQRALLEQFVELAASPELNAEGPLWYRGSVYCKPILEVSTLDAALARLGVERVVVGHTPTVDRRVRSLHDGRTIMLDTGMLASYYAGRPAALIIEDGTPIVQYLMPSERRPPEPESLVAGYPMTEAELRAALELGSVESLASGSSDAQIEVTHAGMTVRATFYPARAAAAAELAAATLDDLLGTDLVSPTVPRTIDGRDGALQLRPADAISETERAARGLGSAGWCDLQPQFDLMLAFDALLHNTARRSDDVLYDTDVTNVTLTRHAAAFGAERRLPTRPDGTEIEAPAAFRDALSRVDEARLGEALGEWLGARRLDALLERRERLLAGWEPAPQR